MTRALITGGGGFVGAYLREELIRYGTEVFSTTFSDARAEASSSTLSLDVRHADEVMRVVRDLVPDEIYHLAGITTPGSGDVGDFFAVNLGGTLNILEAAHTVGASVLVVSSAYVYGAHTGALDENTPLCPVNHYGSSKAAADLAGLPYALAGNRVVRVRPFNHVGPGQSPSFLLPTLVQQLAQIEAGKRDPVIRLGNLDSVRDFTDVRDIVRAYPKLLHEGENGAVYNLASGQGVSVRNLADLVIARAKVKVRLETEAARVRATDIPELVGNATRARETIGWTPEIALTATLDDMLTFERSRYA
jgi:GDP-4-dehydro-6-deoxy-D-mannose reductase